MIAKNLGQSIAEFVISASVLMSFLIIVPMVSKIGTLKLKANSAADYVAWREYKSIDTANSSEMSREVGQRFFARTGADVLSDRNAECDDIEDTDHYGNSLINWRTVESKSSSEQGGFTAKKMKNVYKVFGMFEHNDGKSRVAVSAPVNNQTPFEEIPESLDIKSDTVILLDDLRSEGRSYTRNIVKKSRVVAFYESGTDRDGNQVVNFNASNASEPVTHFSQKTYVKYIFNPLLFLFGFLGEKKINTDEVYGLGLKSYQEIPDDRVEFLELPD